MRHLDGMVQDVLRVAVPEMEAAQELQYLEMHRRDPGFHHGFIPEPNDGLIHLGFYLVDDLLDAAGMYPAVFDQTYHGFAGDFAPHRIETGEQHGSWSIVNEHGN